MAKKSPALTINLFPKQDFLVIKWLSVMGETRPRYASIYAREAIHQYIQDGTYLSLGSVAIDQAFMENVSERTFSVLKDETIIAWIDELSKANLKAAPYVRAVLNKCIQQSSDGNDHIPDIVDLKQLVPNSLPVRPAPPKPAEPTAAVVSSAPAAPESPEAEEERRDVQGTSRKPPVRMNESGIISRIGAKLDDD